MERVKLGNTNEYVSQLCLGSMLMGTVVDETTSFAMLDYFMNEGGNFIDTANCYAWWIGKGEYIGDESELLLGRWMKQRKNRDDVFLATKVGCRLKDPAKIRNEKGEPLYHLLPGEFQFLSPATIQKSIDDSLRRLQTDYIDLYYVHIDDRMTMMEETLEALNAIVKAGKIRHIACSNYRTWRLERARNISTMKGWAAYTAIQQEYSYLRPKPGADFGVSVHVDDELMDYLRSNGDVTLLAYSPLLKGIYEDKAKRESYYNWPLYQTEDSQARLEVLAKMAAHLGVSNSQLVLAWLLHHQPKVIPLVGTSKMEQLKQSLDARHIRLTDADMTVLNNASV